jgi:hypothetical protein
LTAAACSAGTATARYLCSPPAISSGRASSSPDRHGCASGRGGSRVFAVSVEDDGLAESLAGDLGAPPVAEARGAAEAQWRSDRFLVLRSRFGGWLIVYTRSVEDLGAVLAAAARRAPAAGASVRALSAQVIGPGAGELPQDKVLPPEHWAAHPGATRYRGVLDSNVIWVLPEPGGLRIEAYDHHPDAPDRLWRWTSLQRDHAVERRFIRGAGPPRR